MIEIKPGMRWQDISPKDAAGPPSVNCLEHPELRPPMNENGDLCPWPWEPQQLTGAPLGQYHCGYCGAMCMAGMEHPDYREDLLAEVLVMHFPKEVHPLDGTGRVTVACWCKEDLGSQSCPEEAYEKWAHHALAKLRERFSHADAGG